MEDTSAISIVATTSESDSPAILNSRAICRVCQKQFSQYTCPRCNTRYCSLHCYKSHSLRCTESFSRENVMDEMRQLRPTEESKKKMLDILQRFHAQDEQEDSMDEDEPTFSEETLQKVLSGGQLNYDDLSAEEKKLFQRAIASGDLSKLIEPWEPWWLKPSAKAIYLSDEGARLVLLLEGVSQSADDDSEPSFQTEIPPGPEKPLTPLKKLTTVEPSPLLAIHLVDILYSYCFTLRLYNGDWQSDAVEASMVVLGVSSILGQQALPETMLEAVSNCLEQTCSPAFRHAGGLQFGFGLFDDVASLISLGGAAIICALCDLLRMIESAQQELKSDKQRKVNRAEIKSRLKSAERKVYFVMCWVHEQPEEVWSSLSTLVNAEKASQLEHQSNKRIPLKIDDQTKTTSKTIIEQV